MTKSFVGFVREVMRFTYRDTISLHAAAISFFAVFTFIPVLIFSYLIFSSVSEDVATELLITTADTMGSNLTNLLITLAQDLRNSDLNIVAYIIGIIIMLYAMTRLVYFLQKSMNVIWRAKPHKSLLRIEIQHRAISVASIIVFIGLVTLISLQKTTLIQLNKVLGVSFANALFLVASAICLYSIFAFLYKFVPDRHIAWQDVVLGSIFASVLFWVGYFLLQQFMKYTLVNAVYVTISSILIGLVWIYFFAQIFYIGAEICKVYALHYGSLRRNHDEFEQ